MVDGRTDRSEKLILSLRRLVFIISLYSSNYAAVGLGGSVATSSQPLPSSFRERFVVVKARRRDPHFIAIQSTFAVIEGLASACVAPTVQAYLRSSFDGGALYGMEHANGWAGATESF